MAALVKKYNQVMQRYYVQYLAGYDSVVLNQAIQNLNVCPEDESIILSSFYNGVASLSVKQGKENHRLRLAQKSKTTCIIAHTVWLSLWLPLWNP